MLRKPSTALSVAVRNDSDTRPTKLTATSAMPKGNDAPSWLQPSVGAPRNNVNFESFCKTTTSEQRSLSSVNFQPAEPALTLGPSKHFQLIRSRYQSKFQ